MKNNQTCNNLPYLVSLTNNLNKLCDKHFKKLNKNKLKKAFNKFKTNSEVQKSKEKLNYLFLSYHKKPLNEFIKDDAIKNDTRRILYSKKLALLIGSMYTSNIKDNQNLFFYNLKNHINGKKLDIDPINEELYTRSYENDKSRLEDEKNKNKNFSIKVKVTKKASEIKDIGDMDFFSIYSKKTEKSKKKEKISNLYDSMIKNMADSRIISSAKNDNLIEIVKKSGFETTGRRKKFVSSLFTLKDLNADEPKKKINEDELSTISVHNEIESDRKTFHPGMRVVAFAELKDDKDVILDKAFIKKKNDESLTVDSNFFKKLNDSNIDEDKNKTNKSFHDHEHDESKRNFASYKGMRINKKKKYDPNEQLCFRDFRERDIFKSNN